MTREQQYDGIPTPSAIADRLVLILDTIEKRDMRSDGVSDRDMLAAMTLAIRNAATIHEAEKLLLAALGRVRTNGASAKEAISRTLRWIEAQLDLVFKLAR